MERPTRNEFPNFQRLHWALEKLGVDTGIIYREFGIRERDIGEGRSVSMSTYLNVLNRAAELTGRTAIGIDIARTRTVTDLGILGYIARNAPDFERFLALIESYMDLVMPGARASLVEDGETVHWTYELPAFSPGHSRHEVEMSIMQFIGSVRELLRMPDWRPQHVFLQHEPPGDLTPLQDAFGADITFNHAFSGVALSRHLLNVSLNDADPRLLEVLEHQVRRSMSQLKTSDALADRITLLISSSLGRSDVSADKLASHLGMSRRTLHRRLLDQGTSLSRLHDMVVLQVAKESLRDTTVSITELAQKLGYSDASAFHKAFKRLTGLAPLRYRRQHRGRKTPEARAPRAGH
jgi:AraC-like DNA-binding protein